MVEAPFDFVYDEKKNDSWEKLNLFLLSYKLTDLHNPLVAVLM